MGCFVVESTGCVGFTKLDGPAVEVVDGGAGGVPPVGMDESVAARAAEQSIAAAQQVDAGVKLGHAVLVFRLENSKVVDAGRAKAAHGLHPLQRAEPVESEEGFVGTDAHDASAAKFGEVERV